MGWRGDLAIGVRLAVGGGRTSMARFTLSSIGVCIAVLVLLGAASAGTISANRDDRGMAQAADSNPVAGVRPTLMVRDSTAFRGDRITIERLRATGPDSPLPPGLSRMPAADEMVVSQAFLDLYHDPDSALLRPRFPQRVVGVLPEAVVTDPYDLQVYTGLHPDRVGDLKVSEVYRFGMDRSREIQPAFLLVLLIGVVALLVPVFIFIAASTRIAGAERDRRLAALRLVGGDSAQVRRITAAETLVSAVAGMALGAVAFLLLRPLAASVRLLGVGVYSFDVVPNWWLVGVIAVVVPVLAVVTAQTALRRTIIEPLGVVRFARPIRRRALWRLLLVAAGVGLLLWNGGGGGTTWAVCVAAGTALMLVGVPALLPVVVERAVARLRGGPPSWQLAVRRLQLDSGTSARVIGGIAVVLAGAIALQSLLVSQAAAVGLRTQELSAVSDSTARAWADGAAADELTARVSGVEGVEWVAEFRRGSLVRDLDAQRTYPVAVATCGDIERVYRVMDCQDGDVFVPPDENPARGRTLLSVTMDPSDPGFHVIGEWAIPTDLRRLPPTDSPVNRMSGLIATPSAAPPMSAGAEVSFRIKLDPDDPDAIERVRNVAFGLALTDVYLDSDVGPSYTEAQQTFLTIQRGLLIGSIFTLMLAGVSLLVLAVEHIRERRRPLAVLAASGVPTGSIARSLLWQIGVPIGLGVVVAVGTGVGLAALVNRMTNDPLLIDWTGVGVMTGAAVLLGLLVCLVTLPFLRGATRVESLRTE